MLILTKRLPPTPDASLIRLLVAPSLENDLDLYDLDAEQALAQSDLDTEMFTHLPPDYGKLSGKFVHHSKSFYGLKEASRMRNELLVSKFREYGFEQCLFINLSIQG